MARIRSIKPTFFTSLTIAGLPVTSRLTFVGLWTYCDDMGRARDDVRLVKAAVWPLDDGHTQKKVEADLAELEKAGLIERYRCDGQRYLRVRSWQEHQRINRPSPSTHPSSPEESVRDQETLTEGSSPEGNKEGNKEAAARAHDTGTGPADEPAAALIDEAFGLIADRRIEANGNVKRPRAYRRTVLDGLRDELTEMAERILAETPDLDAAGLAERLDPTAGGEDLDDLAARAAAEQRRRQQLPPCAECDNTGWAGADPANGKCRCGRLMTAAERAGAGAA